ncbi:MAG: hypothetical protein U0841_20410 [Chloroflexia bacterium]
MPDPARPPDEPSPVEDEGAALRGPGACLEDQRITLELQLAGCSGREIADALDRSPEAVHAAPAPSPGCASAARPFPRPNGRTAAQEEPR